MDPIPPTKKLFSDHRDIFPPKDLHHHHLSPNFSSFNNPSFRHPSFGPPIYSYSSAAQNDSRSQNSSYLDRNKWQTYENRPPNFGYEGSRFERIPPPQQAFSDEYRPPFFAYDNINQPYDYGCESGLNYGYQTEPYHYIDYHTASLTDNYLRRVPIEETPLRSSVKGFLEYVPFEKKYVEHVPVEKIEYVPIEKSYMDYYAVEKQIEYVPKHRYETKVEYVPQQIVDHIPQTYVDYVPVKKQEFVPVERMQEVVDYQPIDTSIIHYPQVEKQFIQDAERSGRIRMDLAGGYVPPQIASGNSQSQLHYGKNSVSPVIAGGKMRNFNKIHVGEKSLDQSSFGGNNNTNVYQNNVPYPTDNNYMPYNFNYNYNQNLYPATPVGLGYNNQGFNVENQMGQTPGIYPGVTGYDPEAPAYYPRAPAYYPGAPGSNPGTLGYYPETNGYNNQGFIGERQNRMGHTAAYAKNPQGKFNEPIGIDGRNKDKWDLESLKKKLGEGKKIK